MAEQMAYPILTPTQRNFFEQHGYLVVEDALPATYVQRLSTAIDEIHEREIQAGRLEEGQKLNMRNCIVQHEAFLPLLDWSTTVPLAWQLLNWNIQMVTSHLIGLPSRPEPPDSEKRKVGLHRDGGTSPREMQEPHPRILLKIAYIISDQSDASSGATVVVPGSNRMTGPPPLDLKNGGMHGAIPMTLKPGSAFLFEQRVWHGEGRNWSGQLRKTIFFGYAYRWVKPMDYIQMPDELVARCNPIQKQLLGVVKDPMSYYIPQDEDVPIKALVE